MFGGESDASSKAAQAADFFADYGIDGSHALGIDRDQAAAAGLKIAELEADQPLQDAVLSVHHATMHTFAAPATKIIENHLGRAFVQIQQIAVPMQLPAPMAPPPTVP